MATIARALGTTKGSIPALFVNTFHSSALPACQSSQKHAQFSTHPARRRLLSQGAEKAAVNVAEEVRSFVQKKDAPFKQYKDLCKCSLCSQDRISSLSWKNERSFWFAARWEDFTIWRLGPKFSRQDVNYSAAVNSFYARGSRPSAESFTVLLKALLSGAQQATGQSADPNVKPPIGIIPRSNNEVSER